jgi:hypothetical protein
MCNMHIQILLLDIYIRYEVTVSNEPSDLTL